MVLLSRVELCLCSAACDKRHVRFTLTFFFCFLQNSSELAEAMWAAFVYGSQSGPRGFLHEAAGKETSTHTSMKPYNVQICSPWFLIRRERPIIFTLLPPVEVVFLWYCLSSRVFLNVSCDSCQLHKHTLSSFPCTTWDRDWESWQGEVTHIRDGPRLNVLSGKSACASR